MSTVTMEMKAHKMGWHAVRTVLDKATSLPKKICGKVHPDQVFTYTGPLSEAPFGWAVPTDPEQRKLWQAEKDAQEARRKDRRRAAALVGAEALARTEAEMETRIVARLQAQGLLAGNAAPAPQPAAPAPTPEPDPLPEADPPEREDGIYHKGGAHWEIVVDGVTSAFQGKKVDAEDEYKRLVAETALAEG